MNILKRVIIVFIISLFYCFTAIGEEIKDYKIVDGFSSPESVIKDSIRGQFFVSNVGEKLQPTEKDNDGFVSLVSTEGEIIEKNYFSKYKLHAPKGMAIINNKLFVTDVDRVVGFDINSRNKIFEFTFVAEKTVFLNDITVLDNENLLVSATDIGVIYQLTIGQHPFYMPILDNIKGVNGLFFDKKTNQLFINTYYKVDSNKGELGRINFNDKIIKYEVLVDNIGNLDGICFYNDSLIFSDWNDMGKKGKIWGYDIMSKNISEILPFIDLQGPADFCFDEETNNIWIPLMKKGQILIKKIEN